MKSGIPDLVTKTLVTSPVTTKSSGFQTGVSKLVSKESGIFWLVRKPTVRNQVRTEKAI